MWRLVVCFLSLTVSSCLCLYEDQLGKVDWHRRGIGSPLKAFLHPRKPRLVAITDTRLVTQLRLRDGAIQWRQKQDREISHLFTSKQENTTVSVSHEGTVIRCWSQIDGALRWEHIYETAPESVHYLDGAAPQMLYVQGKSVELRNGADGVMWSKQVDPLTGCGGTHIFTDGGSQMTLISVCRKGRLLLTSFDLVSGNQFFTREYSLENWTEASVVEASVMEEHIVVKNEKRLCVLNLNGVERKKRKIRARCERRYSLPRVYFDKQLRGCHCLCGLLGVAEIQETKKGQLESGLQIPDYVVHSDPVLGNDIEAVAIVSKTEQNGWTFEVVDMLTGSSRHREHFTMLPTDFQPERIFLGTYMRQNSTLGFRFLVVGTHAELYMLQQGQIVWERNEVVSGVVATIFVDPPTHGSHLKADPSKWIQSQILSLKVQFNLNSRSEKEHLMELRSDLSGKKLAVKDASGYRKFIIVLTKYKSVVALHNGDGRILWQTKLTQSFDGLTTWSYSHSEDVSPKVLLYQKGSDSHSVVVDAHNGEILHREHSPIYVSKMIKLPRPVKKGTTDQAVFLLVDMRNRESPVGCFLPAGDAHNLRDTVRKFVLWDADRDDGILRGYGVRQMDFEENRLEFVVRWTLNFHSKILSISERGYDDPVHSYTKVLGDRSLLFKYLNPNTALIITGDDGDEFGDHYLEAFVIDTVTGRILFRQIHEAAKGPVHGVISQHWASYHYWSITNQRFQMSTIEMYDASHRQLTVSDLVLGAFEQQEEISSYDPIPVRVFNATFFLSTAVKSLSVTKTLKGITTQLLLMGTVSDQIYSMNKRFLDPRRPIRSTQQTQDERLLPYAENLPVLPTHYTSYNHHILAMRGIVTSPAALESAAHLFAFGDDVYYTRLQPERGFDTLDEDFNYAFLILTLIAMIVGSVVCHYMVRDAKVARKWK